MEERSSSRSTTARREPPVCPHCGQTLIARFGSLDGEQVLMGYKPCTCDGAVEERKEREAAERAAEEQREERDRLARYTKAGIGLRYVDAESEKAKGLLDMVKGGMWAYIIGPVGSGKTHLACAMARLAIDEGLNVQVVDSPSMLGSIKASYGEASADTEDDAVRRLASRDILVIDDLGKEAPTEWTLSMLFRVVDGRYRNLRPTVVTTQFRRSDLAARLARRGDRETAQAIVSRLSEACVTVVMNEGDRRLE